MAACHRRTSIARSAALGADPFRRKAREHPQAQPRSATGVAFILRAISSESESLNRGGKTLRLLSDGTEPLWLLLCVLNAAKGSHDEAHDQSVHCFPFMGVVRYGCSDAPRASLRLCCAHRRPHHSDETLREFELLCRDPCWSQRTPVALISHRRRRLRLRSFHQIERCGRGSRVCRVRGASAVRGGSPPCRPGLRRPARRSLHWRE